MQTKIRCAILGLGPQACEHLTASIDHPELEIIAAIEINSDVWQKIQQQYPQLKLRFFKSLADFKSSNLHVDAFILALPHHAYEKIWDELTTLQLPLLKEKPLGRSHHEARDFMLTAAKRQCGLMTAIQRREHPSYQFLAQYLAEHKIIPTEIYAHMHLGKGSSLPEVAEHDLGWRACKAEAGGGALLDAGYHMIDLLQYLVGDFNVISATMWNGDKADNGLDIEDRCWLMAHSQQTWIMLDTWVKGVDNGKGGYQKSEVLLLKTGNGLLKANREGVWLNEIQLFDTEREWTIAMQKQLSNFAKNIQYNDWSADIIWDQLPAMRKIEEAYRISAQY